MSEWQIDSLALEVTDPLVTNSAYENEQRKSFGDPSKERASANNIIYILLLHYNSPEINVTGLPGART